MSQGRPSREKSLPNLGIPSIEDDTILRPRKRQVTEPFFLDNQRNDHLSPPTNRHNVSDSGRSQLTFASLDSVYDRGTTNYAAWEQALGTPSHPDKEHRKILGSRPITRQNLDDALWEQAKSSNVSTERFLPLDKLKALINRTTVEELLKSTKLPSQDVEYLLKGIFRDWQVQAVHCKAKDGPRRTWPGLFRTFALLVLVDKVPAIRQFVDHGLDDSLLPIFLPTGEQGPGSDHSTAHCPVSMGNDIINNKKLQQCFANFTKAQLLRFCSFQKLVNVPFFLFPAEDFNVSYYELDPECVLPFIDVGPPKSGAYGSVKRIVIHPAHHNYSNPRNDNPPPAFAVKTLLVHDVEKFKKEVEVSERLVKKRHHESPDHLVHLELAYRHGEQCCLVLPWADGNLKEYWEAHPKGYRSPTNYNDVLWFFKQCFGLAKGLSRLHHPASYAKTIAVGNGGFQTADDILAADREKRFGRHGDIKPENILWFMNYNDDLNHLAICDFGSTEFNSIYSKSHVDARGVTGYTQTYQPPDTRVGPEVSQKIDVWSLGCVFLEFVSWFLLGYHETVHEFSQRRMRPHPQYSDNPFTQDRFFAWETNRHSELGEIARVNPAVVEWIWKVHSLNTCPKSIHDFLDLIQDQMLQPTASDRSDCKTVRTQLLTLYETCKTNEIYATAGYGKVQNHEKDFVRQSRYLSGLGNHYQSLSERHPVPFPGLSDEMRDQASLTTPRPQEVQVEKEPPSQVNEPSHRSRPTRDAVKSDLPVLLSKDTTKSSYDLSQMVTNDTTPYTTQPAVADFSALEYDNKRGKDLENEVDYLRDDSVAFNGFSWPGVSRQYATASKASSISKKDSGLEGNVELPVSHTVVDAQPKRAKSPSNQASLPQAKSAKPKVQIFQGVRAILRRAGRTFRNSDGNKQEWKIFVTQKWERYWRRNGENIVK